MEKQLPENSSNIFEKPQVVKDGCEGKFKEELFKQIGQLRANLIL